MELTEVLIVGVAHLDGSMPTGHLDRGLRHLLDWRPDLVAVETLPGHLVREYEERGGVFADFPVGWAPQARRGAAVAQQHLAHDLWTAHRIARSPESTLRDRVLAWLVVREPLNALVLPWQDANLPEDVAALLVTIAASPSERVQLGVRIARALRHDEVVPIDDHTGLAILERFPSHWSEVLNAHLEPGAPLRADTCHDAWDEWVNVTTEEFRNWSESHESRYLLEIEDAAGIARARLAQWRTRNLAMAARIREATAHIPGGRLLVIVGSSHERPLRAALSIDQHDIHLTDISTLES